MSNAKKIWDSLKSRGLNDFAVAGIMGNLYAESGLQPNNLQNSYQKSLGFTDESYTEEVDNGNYDNFVKDCAGYGLAQWTFWTRKQALLNYAREYGSSIGDLTMQLGFFWQELQGYKGIMQELKTATSVRAASDVILLQYERPRDQSETVRKKRASYGQKFYDEYAATAEQPAVQDEYKVGDVVEFTGTKHYVSTNAVSGKSCKSGRAEVTQVYQLGKNKHPYHLKAVSGSTSNVHGWVDAADIDGKVNVKPDAPTQRVHTVKKGDTLSTLAKKYDTTVAAILAANKVKYPKISASYIMVGWKLTV